MTLWTRLLHTTDDRVAAFLRVTLGLIIFPHGAQKALGMFGGYGFEGTMGFFTGQLGVPYVFAVAAIAAEFFGGIALVAGVLTRVAALGVAVTMAMAIKMVHLQHGFFNSGSGEPGSVGYEFNLTLLLLAVAVLVRGGGAWSVDRLLARRGATAAAKA